MRTNLTLTLMMLALVFLSACGGGGGGGGGAFEVKDQGRFGDTGPTNQPPEVTDISDQITIDGTSLSTLSFTITDPEGEVLNCAITGKSSSNSSLIPTSAISVTGTAPNCSVDITPVAGQTGSSVIRLDVSDSVNTTSDTFTVVVAPDGPYQVAFSTGPSDADEDTIIAPAIVVEIQNALGVKETTATNSVTLAIGTDPTGGSTLGGTTTSAAVSGDATFSTIDIDQPGDGFTLVASSPGLVSSTSSRFNINRVPTPIPVTVNQASGQADPTSSFPVQFTVVFDRAVDASTFTSLDVSQNGTATGISWNIVDSGDSTTFTLEATTISGMGTIQPSILAGGILDSFGDANLASTSTDNTVTVQPITVTVEQGAATSDPSSELPVEFDVVFSDVVDPFTFDSSDVTNSGTAPGVTWSVVNTGDSKNFKLQAITVTGSGTLIPSLAAGTVQNSGGLSAQASTSTDNSVTYQYLGVTVNQAAAQVDPTGAWPVVFDVVFTSPINPGTFTDADITQDGSVTGLTWTVIDSGDNTNFTIEASGGATAGTIEPRIAAAAVQTAGGTKNQETTYTDNTVTYIPFNVTVEEASGQSDPDSTLPIEFDVVFSSATDGASFDTSDIVQNGTATGITWNLINSGDDTNYTLQATGATSGGTVIPSIAANTVTSASAVGNAESTSTDNEVTYTPLEVTIEQSAGQNDPTGIWNIEFDVTFTEPIDDSTFTTADITQNGTATGVTWNLVNSGNDTDYTLQAIGATSAGTIIPSLAAAVVSTAGGLDNYASTSTDNSVTYEILTVTIEQKAAQADPTSAVPVEWDVVFNLPIDNSTFIVSDITQAGTATGVTWNLINSGDDTNYTIQATAVGVAGTLIPNLAANVVNTPSAALNQASTSVDNTVTFLPLSVTVEQKAAQADPTSVAPIEFDVVFDQAIDDTTFVVGDITQNGTATGITWTIINSGDDINFTLRATTVTGAGTLIPSLAAGVVATAGGANNSASTSTDNSVTYLPLAVTIDQKAAQADPTAALPIEFDVIFNQAIDDTTFVTADVTTGGTATGVTWNLVNSGDDINFTLQATAVATDGTVIPSLASNTVQTAEGGNNSASTSTDNTVTYANLAVTVEQKAAQADPTGVLPIEFDIVFNQAIDDTTFVVGDITEGGTATGITWNIINSGDDINFTLQATAITGAGTVIPSLSAGVVQTAGGTLNQVSTSTDNTVTFQPLTVTVEQKAAQADPTGVVPVEFDVVFSEAIDDTTFVVGDITESGTATGVTWNIVNSGDDINFTLQATAVTGAGTLIPSLGAGVVATAAAASNLTSTSTDNSVTFVPLSVTIEQKAAQADPTSTLPIEWDVVFSQAIDDTTFVVGDLTQAGTATGVTWNIVNSGDDINFTLQATAVTGGGTLIPNLAAATVQTAGGDDNLASTSTDNTVTYQLLTVTIDQKAAQADPAAGLPIEFDVVFSEAIDDTTFVVGDITDSGTATGITWNIVNSGDDINFTLQATAITGDGTLIPSLGAAVVQTAGGASNQASTSTDNEVTYAALTVTIEQAAAQADPTNAVPVEFDVVFNQAIDDTTFIVGDITQNGTATGITWNISNSGDDINFTLQATAITGVGTVIPSLGAAVVQTADGGDNAASTSTDNSVTYDQLDVTIEQKAAQADPTATTPIEWDVVFSQAIDETTFVVGDITQSGSASGITWNIINSGDDINFTLQATAIVGAGTLVPDLAAGVVATATAITNNASSSTDNSVTYTVLDVTVNQKVAQADPTNTLPIEFDVIFTQAIDDITFVVGDITQNGTATGVTWNIINSGDDINFTLQAIATTSDGTIEPSLAGGVVSTSGGSTNTASTSTDNSVTYDTVAPILTLSDPASDGEWVGATTDVSGTCDEAGGTVNLDIDGGTVTETAACDGISWSVTLWDISAVGDGSNITLTVDLDDAAGNSATQVVRLVNKESTPPSDVTAVTFTTNDANRLNAITVDWTAATDANGIDSYEMAIGTTSGGTEVTGGYVNVGNVITYQAASGTDFTGSLVTGQNYFTSVRAIDVGGNRSTVQTSSAWQYLPPNAISNLSVATTLRNSAEISWSVSNPGGAVMTDYIVEYREDGDTTWISFNDGISTSTFATVDGLLADTTYEFRVQVQYDMTNTTAFSNVASGATKPDDPIFDNPYKAMNVGGATLTRVVAMEDNTEVTLPDTSTVNLDAGDVHQFASAQFDIIEADQPIYVAGKKGTSGNQQVANIVWNPVAWAGKTFSYNATRNNPQKLHFYAVEATTVEVREGTTLLDSGTVGVGGTDTLSWSNYGSYQVTSTGTILAFSISNDTTNNYYDPKPLMPAHTEIIGFPSQSMQLTTTANGTNYTYIHSNSNSNSNTININQSVKINPQGGTTSLYRAESLLITADQEIAGASYADSNGYCAAPFMPTNLMKRKYAINQNSDYVAFASKQPGTIEVYNSAGTLVTTGTLARTGSNPNAPYKFRFANRNSGDRFISTVPMAGWYQPNTSSGGAGERDETILYGLE